MLPRPDLLASIRSALRRSPVVALLGPRQSGKTTLARELVRPDSVNYFDLEDPASLRRLQEPMTALQGLRGLVAIDEIPHRPELFPFLRVLVDRRPIRARFLVLGSASPELLRQSSESLAGRIETVMIGGFSLSELGPGALDRHWLRGGFPRAWLARNNSDSLAWRESFVRTFLERDLPGLGLTLPPLSLLRFWTMLAHYHGQVWKSSEPARSLGISEPTVRRYLNSLSGLFLVRQLAPWFENMGKRQVRSPKIYIRDSGVLHWLLGIRTQGDLLHHPKCGASWEGYVIEEAIRLVRPDEAYFWATHQGAELDLLLLKRGRKVGLEVKRVDAPGLTASMRIAIEDLRLERLSVLYPGRMRFAIADRVEAVPVTDLARGDPEVLLGNRRVSRPRRP